MSAGKQWLFWLAVIALILAASAGKKDDDSKASAEDDGEADKAEGESEEGADDDEGKHMCYHILSKLLYSKSRFFFKGVYR